MHWQLVAVILIVTAASCYLLRQTWRAWIAATKPGCGGGCGCAGRPGAGVTPRPEAVLPPEQLTLRRRERDPS
jgi:hypothetical protein